MPEIPRTRCILFLLGAIALFTVALSLGCSRAASPDSNVSLSQTQTIPTSGDSSRSVQQEDAAQVIPPDQPLIAPSEVPEELRIVWETWAFLTRDYIDRADLDPSELSEAAVRGMLAALGDPHTGYVGPETFAVDANDVFEGEFEGIGAHVETNRAGKLIVVSPIAGSPAEAAGIRAGDIILAVNGVSIEGLSTLEAVAIIRGPKGTPVRLLVQHLGAVDPIELEIIRGTIPLESVIVRSQAGDAIIHIRLTNFYPETAQQMVDAVRKAVDEGARGLILDVRGNPGGLLDSVIDVASQFLDGGIVLYQIDGGGNRTNHNVRTNGQLKTIPMVVLVNQGSASASEVLTGALQDRGRATVVGATTYGKGSVNILRPLSNGGGVWISRSRWYTPNGNLIQGVGIEPDIKVTAVDPRDADVRQLERAYEVLNAQLGS
ncbi:MAG: S41 family peptidase [SAR202 cluster bacterium]|nr:S41 family peptidase [SAR202 cluster bacterium]